MGTNRMNIEEIKRKLDWMVQNVANEDAYLMGDALSIIEQLQAEIESLKKESEWISVADDRKPDVELDVWCYGFTPKGLNFQARGGLCAGDKKVTFDDYPYDTVTHWKPLPKPPEQ